MINSAEQFSFAHVSISKHCNLSTTDHRSPPLHLSTEHLAHQCGHHWLPENGTTTRATVYKLQHICLSNRIFNDRWQQTPKRGSLVRKWHGIHFEVHGRSFNLRMFVLRSKIEIAHWAGKTTTTRCGITDTAATLNFVLWLFLNIHNALWHVKISRDAKVVLWLLTEMTITSSDFVKIPQVVMVVTFHSHDAMWDKFQPAEKSASDRAASCFLQIL